MSEQYLDVQEYNKQSERTTTTVLATADALIESGQNINAVTAGLAVATAFSAAQAIFDEGLDTDGTAIAVAKLTALLVATTNEALNALLANLHTDEQEALELDKSLLAKELALAYQEKLDLAAKADAKYSELLLASISKNKQNTHNFGNFKHK